MKMTLRDLFFSLIGPILNIIYNLISSALFQTRTNTLLIVLSSFAIYLVLFFVFWFKRQQESAFIRLYQARRIRNDQDKRRYSRRGLIIFLAPYSPVKVKPSELPSPEVIARAIAEVDYRPLKLEFSNLELVIKAVTTHSRRLEHAWFITTMPEDGSIGESLAFAPLMEKYFRHKGIKCQFHYDQKYSICQTDDEQIAVKMMDILKQIDAEAAALKLPPEEMIMDFSSGPRIASFAFILASIDRRRDVEFIGSHYKNGKPTDTFPVIFSYEAFKNG